MSRKFEVPKGMPLSVWENKYARKKPDGTFQTWEERLSEVVDGNFTLDPRPRAEYEAELQRTKELAISGVLPFSGRHLQHGDLNQKDGFIERWTNCSTAMFSFVKFWLLLKGSGVGRCYDSDVCRVNWDYMPNTRFVLSEKHPDFIFDGSIESLEEAKHKYDSESESVRWFTVQDSAEGWVKVVEVLETSAFQEKHVDKLFIFDFSLVRGKGSPIRGQQDRPASGPIPLINVLKKVASIKGSGMRPWKQAMYIDHYMSSCVVLGGIRRSSRIATKTWRDRDVIEFIDIKRVDSDIAKLYTANNSITVDAEFWKQAQRPEPSHARRVFEAAVAAAYFDRTGEPGFLNVDMLTNNEAGIDKITVATYISPEIVKILDIHPKTYELIENTLRYAKKKRFKFIVNPCGEISLNLMGGYCVISDLCLANAETIEETIDAAKLASRFLIRVNRMKALYRAEVDRTNRIGVGITGIHEFAYKHFGYNFRDLLDEDKSLNFWLFIRQLRKAVESSAVDFATSIGMSVPHTFTTIKPSGTVSKVMACTEGAHLPAMAHYLRWVQFTQDAPEVAEHRERGYPIKDISKQYTGACVIGFPTKLSIVDLMGDSITIASEATPSEQYRWLQLLEKYWLGAGSNNQISYTLKYDPSKVSYPDFMSMVLEHQPTVRACSVMPAIDESAYIYTPEESISKERYKELVAGILDRFDKELVNEESLSCDGGACPIESNIN